MEVTYFAQISAIVLFTDEELALLIDSAKKHYDSTVNSLAEQGGTLYGTKNVHDFWKESKDSEKTEQDKARPYTFRELDLMAKGLSDMPYKEEKSLLYGKIFKVLKGINERNETVNNHEILK
jgi:hypothetical protein